MIFSSITTRCQTSPTTTTEGYTTVKTKKLQAGAKLIEIGRINAQLVQLQNIKIDSLNQRIGYLLAAIKAHVEKDSANAQVINTYKAEIDNVVSQRDIAIKEMKHQNKLYRGQKRKLVFSTLASAGITAGVFLYLKSK